MRSAASLLLGAILLLAACGGGTRFDQATWKAWSGNEDPDNPRYAMVDDLLRSHLPVGSKREVALLLLGTPDMRSGPKFLQYNLGMWSGFRVDYDSLDLEFDVSDRLVRASRVQH